MRTLLKQAKPEGLVGRFEQYKKCVFSSWLSLQLEDW